MISVTYTTSITKQIPLAVTTDPELIGAVDIQHHTIICSDLYADQTRSEFRALCKDGSLKYIGFTNVLCIKPHAVKARTRS